MTPAEGPSRRDWPLQARRPVSPPSKFEILRQTTFSWLSSVSVCPRCHPRACERCITASSTFVGPVPNDGTGHQHPTYLTCPGWGMLKEKDQTSDTRGGQEAKDSSLPTDDLLPRLPTEDSSYSSVAHIDMPLLAESRPGGSARFTDAACLHHRATGPAWRDVARPPRADSPSGLATWLHSASCLT